MNYLGEIAQLVMATGVLLNGIVSLLSLRQGRANGRGINQVAKQTDGITKQLVAVTAKKEFEAGVKHEQQHPEAGLTDQI